VTASVVSLSDDEHVLILSADETGTDATMTFADMSGTALETLGFIDGMGAIRNELQAAANARFKVDGLAATIERQSNTVDDVFAGVTLTLFKAEIGTTIALEVERDLNQVKQAIVDFVDAYNEVRTFINRQALTDVAQDDETGAGILAGTSVLSEARSRLSGAIGAAVDGTDPTFAVLAQIGITIQSAGKVADPLQANTLVIDETRLDEALLNEPDAVRGLFAFEMSSSSADVVLASFDGNVRHSATGYQLNVAMSGGVITSANLGGAADGSGNGTIEGKGNVLTVVDGPAKGLKLLYNGTGPASGVQLDLSVGVGAKTFHAVDGMVDGIDGLFAGEIASLEEQNTRANGRIERLDELLERERERLIERFAAMEAALTSMNRLLDSLKDQIDAAFGERR
jgi:flagellar hook-associated protein 2